MAAGSTYTPIATQTLVSAASSVTFSSISGSYTDLRLVITTTNNSPATSGLQLQYNGDTSALYSFTRILGDGSSATSSRGSAQTAASIGYYADDANDFGVFTTDIMNYSNTTTYKTAISRSSAASVMVSAFVSLWRSTSAITSILVKNSSAVNFKAGSTFTLYGIAAA
jgi:hypothetical protein